MTLNNVPIIPASDTLRYLGLVLDKKTGNGMNMFELKG